MAICLLCPADDNEVPDAMLEEHGKIMHFEQITGMAEAGRRALIQAHQVLRAHVAQYRAGDDYQEAAARFEAKPLDGTRIYKYGVEKSFADGMAAAAHILEHLIAGDGL
jgi:hypothetical protein